MTYTPEILSFLISHYTKRLAEEKRTEGKAFIRETLYNLRKSIV